jgi:hypothetical protein
VDEAGEAGGEEAEAEEAEGQQLTRGLFYIAWGLSKGVVKRQLADGSGAAAAVPYYSLSVGLSTIALRGSFAQLEQRLASAGSAVQREVRIRP